MPAKEFDTDEVIRRTARDLSVSVAEVKRFLDTYSDNYIKYAFEVGIRPEGPSQPAPKAASKPARAPRKRAAAKVSAKSQGDNSQTAQEPTEGAAV